MRRGESVEGTLHLTPHHLIFCYTPPLLVQDSLVELPQSRPRELWITYPIIQTCTLRPASAASHLPSSVRLRCRDFTFVCFCFNDEKKARDVYDSIRAWTCKLGRVEKLYAFSYQPQQPESEIDGWTIYDARAEWTRLGVSDKGVDRGWRISRINVDYGVGQYLFYIWSIGTYISQFSPTYPALLPVPSSISDNTLNYAGRYRSRARLPVLTYLHPVNNCSITRSAQPLVGVRGHRSIQDEKLLLAIFSTTTEYLNTSSPPSRPRSRQSLLSSSLDDSLTSSNPVIANAEPLENEIPPPKDNNLKNDGPRIYGAQQHNLIVDARPTVNALAMQAVGLGSENMDHYPFATKVYLGIDNIHVMRDSLNKVVDTLKESDLTPLAPNREALAKSGWLKHITNVLDGVSLITRQIGLQHSHVLIHCSDGWDRTSQLSALSQICLDPYYRTLKGFIVLIEKDWLSFGHMFRHRSGFLSSEKWFHIENDRLGSDSNNGKQSFGNSSSAGHAFENALLSAKGFFNKDNGSRESIAGSEDELQPYEMGLPSAKKAAVPSSNSPNQTTTKVKETSPVFHQFLDATYQLLHQNPKRFEFNERFLRRLLYHLYSCQYGTFLYNNEKERVEAHVHQKTRSVWDYFLSRKEQFINDKYDPAVDDNIRGKERILLPISSEIRWWSELFGRTDIEMNGPTPGSYAGGVNGHSVASNNVITGVETADDAVGAGVPGKFSASQNNTTAAMLAAGIAELGLGKKRGGEGWRSPGGLTKEMEVEMQ